MEQDIGFWILTTDVTVFITTIFGYEFTTKEKIKMICGFSGFIAVLEIVLMLMFGGWK